MLATLQDISFFTEALMAALSVFTLLVTNSPYLAVVKINASTAVIAVDNMTWGAEAFSSKWRLMALVLTV